MPEWRELYAHLLLVLTLFSRYRAESTPFRLLNLYAELPVQAGQQESKVERINGGNRWKTIMKGKGEESSPLAPPQLFEARVRKGKAARVAGLHWDLEDVTGDGRSMVLIFNEAILKVCAGVHSTLSVEALILVIPRSSLSVFIPRPNGSRMRCGPNQSFPQRVRSAALVLCPLHVTVRL